MSLIAEIRGISAEYDGKRVLADASLDIADRDYIGIIGPNGGGKTTFVKCLLGLKDISAGSIRFFKDGRQVKSIDMGYLPQYTAVDTKFPITVRQVVMSGLLGKEDWLGGYTRRQKQEADRVIARMGLDGLADRTIGQLSGGQRQRALLGRAVIARPDLLILDEPSTYVDKLHETKLYELLRDLNTECAIILVSHDIGTVLSNVKSIACINGTLDYHPSTEVSDEWLTARFNCPIDLVGHGNLPHRVLKNHARD